MIVRTKKYQLVNPIHNIKINQIRLGQSGLGFLEHREHLKLIESDPIKTTLNQLNFEPE